MNRCIIPAHGYYEWETLPNRKKVKYASTSGDKHGIFMAGIYDNKADFAVITKPAAENILPIHPRMPLIIIASQAEDWLNGRLAAREVLSPQIYWEQTG